MKSIFELSEELFDRYPGELTRYETLQIAAKIQHNYLFDDAFLVSGKGPNALEAIGMFLRDEIANAINGVASRIEDASVENR
jgi:hypothetical protein